MYISQIHLKNFKSFANAKLKLERSYNAIVGPNGSGKSNVVDSLLFAFGESSLKSMRVKKSTDLIFQNHNIAEVTVLLEDGDKKHTIARVVNRQGKTKYLLDGRRTKKYALEEFLSKNTLSLANIIKQGQVQQIVEMNPRDRRELLDQVANISEYEQKKKEAMGELGQVEDKLKEATTLLGEREGYLKELENEKNNALRWRELKQQLDSLKATLISIDLRSLEEHYEISVKDTLEIETQTSKVTAKIRQIEAEISLKNSEKDAINQQIIVKSTGSEAEVQRSIDSLNMSISNNRKLLEDSRTILAQAEEKLRGKALERQRAFDEVKGALARIAEVKSELEAIGAKLKEKTAEYNQLLSATTNFSQQFHDARVYVQKAGDDMLALKMQLSEMQAEVAKTEEIAAFKERELEKLKAGEFSDFTEKKALLAEERQILERKLIETNKTLNDLFREEKALNERIPSLEDLLLQAREKKAALSSRLRTLSETQSSKAVEAVMALQERISGIYGTLDELISYDSSYGVPVQVALGQRANFVVADSSKTAAKAIEFLKQKRLSRVSFIPLDKIRAQTISTEDKTLGKNKGAMGFVIELLEFDAKYRKAVEFACGNTLLMRDLDSCEALSGKIRMVTKEGELVEQSGLMTGGHFAAKVNIAMERKQLEDWENKAENAQSEKQGVLEGLRDLRDRMSEARKAKAEVDLALSAISIQLRGISEREEGEKSKATDKKSATRELADEIMEGKKKVSALNDERRELVRRLSEINMKMLEAKQKIDLEKEEQLGNMVKERERALSDLKIRLSEYENRLASLETQHKVYEKQNATLEKEELEARQSLDTLKNSIAKADDQIKTDTATLKVKTEEQKKMSKAFTTLLEKRETLDSEIIKKGNEKGKLEFEKEAVERQHGDVKVKKAVIETQLAQSKAQFEQYKDARIIEGKTGKDKPELLALARDTETQIEAIGSVNMRAIDLFELKLSEFEEQRKRVGQLYTEKEAVIGIINEIEIRKTSTFLSTFNAINDNFRKIFSQIFQGDGHLYLDNPASPLEGGLTIEIKLDNKEVKYLEIMSGGEKTLIALCFLLAIQAVKPSGVYILDEADAALDVENSRKFGQLVKALSKDTQFLIVTHNQQVYKSADCLVGIAMAKDGSRAVEVKLNA